MQESTQYILLLFAKEQALEYLLKLYFSLYNSLSLIFCVSPPFLALSSLIFGLPSSLVMLQKFEESIHDILYDGQKLNC